MKNCTKEDLTLLASVQNNSASAFKSIFDKYYTPLCRYVKIIIADQSASEDIVQDLFVSLWINREQIAISVSLQAYLFKAAKFKSLNYLRDHKKHLSLDEEVNVSTDIEVNLELEELENLIQKAILVLPEKCRATFELSRMGQMSHEEISKLQNISHSTVNNHITMATKRIKDFIKKHYYFILLFINT